MKQSLARLAILIPVLFLTACQSGFESRESNLYQIPWLNSKGEYQLQKVTIHSFSEPESLRSPILRIFVTPSESAGRLAAPEAIGRFMTTKNGVRIPLDFISMQAAAVHAHFERIVEFDKAIGVASLLKFPLEVAIETRVTNRASDKTNQAFFDGRRNAILLLPYTDDSREGLPLSLNGGVLAHEHFHSIFFKYVMSGLINAGLYNADDVHAHPIPALDEKENSQVEKALEQMASNDNEEESKPLTAAPTPVPEALEKTQKPVHLEPEITEKVGTNEPNENLLSFNNVIIGAVNEGLADFWAWLYLGDDNFVGRSIKFEKECRRLDKTFSILPNADTVEFEVNSSRIGKEYRDSYRQLLWYRIGAQYARFLKEFVLASYGEPLSYVDRVEIAQTVVRAIEKFGALTVMQIGTKKLSPDLIIQAFIDNLPEKRMNSKACKLLAEFVGKKAKGRCQDLQGTEDEIIDGHFKRLKTSPLHLQNCTSEDERGLLE